MSTKEDTKLPNDPTNEHAMAVHRPSLLERGDSSWASLSGLVEPPQSAALDLSAYLHAVRRHWFMATVLAFICAIIAAVAVWFLWGKDYTAVALVQVGRQEEKMVEALDPRGYVGRSDFEIFKHTQPQLIKRHDILTAALADDRIGSLSIVQREKPHELAWLKEELTAGFPVESEIMLVSLTDRNPKQAAEVVNAVVQAYMRQVVENKRSQQQKKLENLNGLYSTKNRQAEGLRKELRDAAVTYDSDDPETLAVKQRVLQLRLGDAQRSLSLVRSQVYRSTAEFNGQETLLEALDDSTISEYEIQAAANQNPFVREVARQLAMMELEGLRMGIIRQGMGLEPSETQAGLQRRYDEKMSELGIAIREMHRSEYTSEVARLEVELGGWKEQEKLLQKEVDGIQKEVNDLTGTAVEVEMKRIEIEQLDVVLAGVTAERDKLRIELGSPQRIQVAQPAVAPEMPNNPEVRWAVAILAGIIGFCLPIGCIVLWDTRAKRINTSEQVSKGMGLPVIGSMPKIPSRVIRRLGSPAPEDQNWQLRLTESVDGVAASLLRKAELEQTRIILVSSAVGGEGKTTLATQLAMSLARSGRRTVLVDFDLRRPAFDEVFGLPLEPGVSEILRGESELSDAIHTTGTENLSVVTAGSWDRQALAALANGAAGPMFDELRSECEFLVVDSSPILPVADTRIVSQHVDAVVLSVFRDVSQAPKVQAACEILEAFGVRSVEAVVTGSSERPRDQDMDYQSRRLPA